MFVDEIGRVARGAKHAAQRGGGELIQDVCSDIQWSAFKLRKGRIPEDKTVCLP